MDLLLRYCHIILWLFILYFDDTATTEIYTYCHTLSLHDALPFFGAIVDQHHPGGLTQGGIQHPVERAVGLVADDYRDDPCRGLRRLRHPCRQEIGRAHV